MKDWVIIIDPGCVPDRKGPFATTPQLKRFLKEAMAARPYSQILVIGCGSDLAVDDGTVYLEMLDARSKPTARKHRERLASVRIRPPGKCRTGALPSQDGDGK